MNSLQDFAVYFNYLPDVLIYLVGAILFFFISAIVSKLTIMIINKSIKVTRIDLPKEVVNYIKLVITYTLPFILFLMILPIVRVAPNISSTLNHFIYILFISITTYLMIRAIYLFGALFLRNYDVNVKDNLQARAVHTQVSIIRKVLIFVLLIIAISLALMSFEQIRRIGISILASAGIIGIIIGFAAQKSISTLIAGIQIALTQPIRLDDVVIVEGEWGWIEEISLTFVVVRIWDQRRLVVPVSYFIEKPFQNWTKNSSEILGTVFLYLDYTIPVDAIRQELKRIVDSSDLWDGRVQSIVVTDCKEHTIEVRALISAVDSSKAWDLRCLVREKLIEFVQKEYPESLTKIRISDALPES